MARPRCQSDLTDRLKAQGVRPRAGAYQGLAYNTSEWNLCPGLDGTGCGKRCVSRGAAYCRGCFTERWKRANQHSLATHPKTCVVCNRHKVASVKSQVCDSCARKERSRGEKERLDEARARKESGKRKFCQVCLGMPWARGPDRIEERSGSGRCQAAPLSVGMCIAGEWVCRGCRLPYAPEQKPGDVTDGSLRSSAGAATDCVY